LSARLAAAELQVEELDQLIEQRQRLLDKQPHAAWNMG
jgi:hypothetical protein